MEPSVRVPTSEIDVLCQIAGTSERTLQYAFKARKCHLEIGTLGPKWFDDVQCCTDQLNPPSLNGNNLPNTDLQMEEKGDLKAA